MTFRKRLVIDKVLYDLYINAGKMYPTFHRGAIG